MKNSSSTNSDSAAPQETLSAWQQFRTKKRIAPLTIPLLVMATIVEFVILATGWKYQQTVCLPQGMGVTFFGIGPIGATILAVELLKLPLAIWTASRHGWPKVFMLFIGLPLICLLTFQLVKDMAVYEMTTAMLPATETLEKAAAEEVKINHLNGELAAIEKKKADRERKLAELTARQAKAKTDLEEALKHNEEARKDAITLTEYQKKELTDVEARQAAIIKQFDADTEQLNKALADLRTRRETEVGRASQWNAEEARIENDYKTKMAEYTNKKTAYEKEKAEYESANFIRRKLMKEPVDPGVPPVREVNTFLKPTILTELESQIKAKESELADVNNKRRERVAQVAADARRLREEFDRRSTTKRDETDRKREESMATLAASAKEWKAEQEQADQELAAAVKKVDGIRAEVDAARKKAEGLYEQREAAIRKTQVHRIATTVEIVRGLIRGERPVSITASAKERGDLLTDQISMVRIWVYPVLAFIVAFLPTLMVEVGFSTLFKPEEQRPPHRFGFFGKGLHWIETRAGRQKILRAERMARDAAAEVAARDKALAAAKATSERIRMEKESEVQTAQEAIARAAADHEQQLQKKEEECATRIAEMSDALNRAVSEKNAVVESQKTEIDRQVELRQDAWADQIAQLRQQLEEQRAAGQAERAALLDEQRKQLAEVSEDSKNQIAQARRQLADFKTASAEASGKLADDLKEALKARDKAESELKRQADTFLFQLSQAKEDAAHQKDTAARDHKNRLEKQQLEFEKAMRQREEEFERRLQQREQELSVAADARTTEEKTAVEQEARRHHAELESQFEARARDIETRWKQTLQQRDEAAQIKLKQREQELQAQVDARLNDVKTQAEQELRRREAELQRQIDAQSRESVTRLRQESQQQETAFHAKLKQREQELTTRSSSREVELQNQYAADLRAREEEWERQAQAKIRQREQQLQSQFDAAQAELQARWDQDTHSRQQEWERNAEAVARATESRYAAEVQQKEEVFQSKLRQRDQHWQDKLSTVRAELQAHNEQEVRRREAESAEERQRALRELEAHVRKDLQEKNELAQAEAKQREKDLLAQIATQTEAHQKAEKQWKKELEIVQETFEPFKALLVRAEKERDEARQSVAENSRQVQDLKRKLSDASSLLASWKNGDDLVSSTRS